jgi:hypothetical protein
MPFPRRHVPRIHHTVALTGRPMFGRFPGNELPGYDHLVPTDTPIRRFAHTPTRPASVSLDPGGDGFRQVFTGARLHYAGCFSRVRQKAAFDQHRG